VYKEQKKSDAPFKAPFTVYARQNPMGCKAGELFLVECTFGFIAVVNSLFFASGLSGEVLNHAARCMTNLTRAIRSSKPR